MSRPTQLNIIVKLTSWNGWRREWDVAFRDGAPVTVTLSQFSAQNEVVTNPAPVMLSPEQFFEEFAKHWGVGAAP